MGFYRVAVFLLHLLVSVECDLTEKKPNLKAEVLSKTGMDISELQELSKKDSTPPPIILIPGDGGSQIEAKLNKTDVVHYLCDKHTEDFFDLWLNLELLVPLILDCWVDNMRLEYDNVTRTTHNPEGVTTRVPGFGNTTTVEFLDPSNVSPSRYFIDVVKALLDAEKKYKRGETILGAPFDFRRAPNELSEYFIELKKLIEDTYENQGKRRVVLLAHSMGSLVSVYFLNQQSQSWKDKYVACLVSLAGAFGGAVKALKVFAAGENLGIIVLSRKALRTEQMTSPSLAFLLPSRTFWNSSEVLVSRPSKNYTVNDYEEFFRDMNYSIGFEMWKDTSKLLADFPAPNVEIHCLHGYGINTIEQVIYKKESNFPMDPDLIYGDGDGTVNIRSLQGCLKFKEKQKQQVYHFPIKGAEHMEIIRDPQALQYLVKLVKTDKAMEMLRHLGSLKHKNAI
ncbi:unnamed protein product [Darwinula stevensoni]|uniref:Group XV phospholipase A2 n=1 Tax=Darwinula stevensoni TaxID=69355 RepID=A0A7R8X4M8_9CRUS|nr:unnamed protein product [Darwinula stevensoni]CAG0886208.1 unnamed protein product [Darwinula stevensoni]